jgi:hypothetical protein
MGWKTIAAAIATLAVCAMPASAGSKTEKLEPERTSDAPDKMICKRYPETGSLVRTVKVCATKADWEKKRQDLQRLSVSNGCRVLSEGGRC